jgi:hypothetical protein
MQQTLGAARGSKEIRQQARQDPALQLAGLRQCCVERCGDFWLQTNLLMKARAEIRQ